MFLYSTEDGTQYQITRTPEISEMNLDWVADSRQFHYETSDNKGVTVTVQDVIAHPNSDIPMQIDAIMPTLTPVLPRIFLSRDGSLIAGLDRTGNDFTLWLANADLSHKQTVASLKESYNVYADVIGWRP